MDEDYTMEREMELLAFRAFLTDRLGSIDSALQLHRQAVVANWTPELHQRVTKALVAVDEAATLLEQAAQKHSVEI